MFLSMHQHLPAEIRDCLQNTVARFLKHDEMNILRCLDDMHGSNMNAQNMIALVKYELELACLRLTDRFFSFLKKKLTQRL